MPTPTPQEFGGKFGLVLFAMHAVDTLGLLRGACGPFMGHCVIKITKTATFLISKLDLVQNRVFPPCAQPIFGLWLPQDPKNRGSAFFLAHKGGPYDSKSPPHVPGS